VGNDCFVVIYKRMGKNRSQKFVNVCLRQKKKLKDMAKKALVDEIFVKELALRYTCYFFKIYIASPFFLIF
jgi:hypothetical protein